MFPELSSIKTRRQILGIKQKDLAIKAKVSQSMIAKLESGKLEPSYTIVKRIFSILENLEHKKEKTCLEIMSKNMICLKTSEAILICEKDKISGIITKSNIL